MDFTLQTPTKEASSMQNMSEAIDDGYGTISEEPWNSTGFSKPIRVDMTLKLIVLIGFVLELIFKIHYVLLLRNNELMLKVVVGVSSCYGDRRISK
ncbi:hypothetical protein V2J09_022244 [Rumex salicifolius]